MQDAVLAHRLIASARAAPRASATVETEVAQLKIVGENIDRPDRALFAIPRNSNRVVDSWTR